MIRYPSIVEYNQSAQHPSSAFTDPELANGTLATSGLGLPIVLGGGFALTYTVTGKARKFALRCFHRYVPDLKQRYAQISDAISGLGSDHFVSFEYQREGVRVAKKLYPVVKMAWAEGPTLGSFIEDNYADSAAMQMLRSSFRELAQFLNDRNIAHGDLENGNMVVRDGNCLTLIDYDGMYVPGMTLGDGNELGHAHFQHPGRTHEHFGPRIDDFSFIMIDLSLDAIARDSSLYEQYCNGDNILFQKTDFEAPGNSAVFNALRKIPDLKEKVDAFAAICKRPIEQTPTLEDFLAGNYRSRVTAASPASRTNARVKPAGVSNLDYIRSALAKGPQEPNAGQPHASASGRSMIPKTGSKGRRTAGVPYADEGGWSRWITLSVFALIVLAVLKSL